MLVERPSVGPLLGQHEHEDCGETDFHGVPLKRCSPGRAVYCLAPAGVATVALTQTITSPRANWRATISQDGQAAKRQAPNRGARNEPSPEIGEDFVPTDAKTKSA